MSVFVKLYNEKPYGKTDSENGEPFYTYSIIYSEYILYLESIYNMMGSTIKLSLVSFGCFGVL